MPEGQGAGPIFRSQKQIVHLVEIGPALEIFYDASSPGIWGCVAQRPKYAG